MADQNLLPDLAFGYAMVLATPGPSALAVSRAGMTGSSRMTMAAAFGASLGAGLAVTLAAFGASAIPSLRLWSQLGAVCLALLMCRSAIILLRDPFGASPADRPTAGRAAAGAPDAWPAAFALGLVAAIGNPVSLPWFLVFFVSHAASAKTSLLGCGLIFTMALIGFGLLGIAVIRVCGTAPGVFQRRGIKRGVAAGCLFVAARTVWLGFVRS